MIHAMDWAGWIDLQQQTQHSTQPHSCTEHYYIFSAGSCSDSRGGFTWKRSAHLTHLAGDERPNVEACYFEVHLN